MRTISPDALFNRIFLLIVAFWLLVVTLSHVQVRWFVGIDAAPPEGPADYTMTIGIGEDGEPSLEIENHNAERKQP